MLSPEMNKCSASSIGIRTSPTGPRLQHRAASAIGLLGQRSTSGTQSLRPPGNVGTASITQLPSQSDLTKKVESLAVSRSDLYLKVPGSKAHSRRSFGSAESHPTSTVSQATRIESRTPSAASIRSSQSNAARASVLGPSELVKQTGSSQSLSKDGERKGEKVSEDFSISKADEMSSASATEQSDTSVADEDIFAPTTERVQTIDFSRILSQSIQITKNEQKKKTNVLGSLKKHVKNFFHEDRVGQVTDEQGNVELPMDPCIQAREDHDSGLLPSQQLFRLARHEQLQLQDRNLQHKQRSKHPHATGESVDDYEFAWLVKRKSKSVGPSVADDWRSLAGRTGGAGLDRPDGMVIREDDESNSGINENGEALKTTGNTHQSKVGSDTVDFNLRIDRFIRPIKKESLENPTEVQRQSEQEKARKAQLLSLCGLVAPPTSDALSPEEQAARDRFREELRQDTVDGSEERYPCECCERKDGSSTSSPMDRPARYYDLLFAHRKNDSFTVRFDMVHCLPRFLLHYKFHKQLYDCLDATERKDLVKAATDIVLSYNLNHCTLQMPYGKYRTNAFPAFFAYIIVPDPARYLEIFEVCNPPVKPGERQKKNSCAIPNWPDKSYVTEFWTYSKESSSPSDKDPRLASNLYEKNVRRKLQLVQMPELLVTRRNPPPELASPGRKPARQQRGDFDIFEDFVLIPHQEQPMLGFGSVQHPAHASDSRSPQTDIKFLDRLLHAMNSYVRKHVNTRQRRLDGKEDLSCTVNLSLQHSYAFKGHQRVYGFIGFPPASTFWTALAEEQRQNAALAGAAVTQEDIRLMQAAQARSESSQQGGDRDETITETSADRTEVAVADEDLQEKLKSCVLL